MFGINLNLESALINNTKVSGKFANTYFNKIISQENLVFVCFTKFNII